VSAPAVTPLGDLVDWAREVLQALLALPPQASTFARGVDGLQDLEIVFFAALGALVLGAAALFSLRYRRGRRGLGPTPRVKAPLWLEGGLALFLLATFLVFWWLGFRQYAAMASPPPQTLDVWVTAKQWVWKFAYAQGPSSAGVLFVPLGRPVRLVMTSRDVIHSFYVPAFRVKQDAVPGRYTTAWFEATQAGRWDLDCAEFCGAGHSRMLAQVVVLPAPDFDAWMRGQPADAASGPEEAAPVVAPYAPPPSTVQPSLAERGIRVAAERGCLRCHTLDGTPHIGPTWRGLWMRPVRMADGSTVIADAGYLTESMMDPEAKFVAGYQDVMPSYQGQLAPAEAAALVELIRSLGDPEPAPGGGGPGWPIDNAVEAPAPPPAHPFAGPVDAPPTGAGAPPGGASHR